MSLILGLWSVTLEPGKTYSQNTTPAIQITNISFGAEVKGDARTVVSMKYPDWDPEDSDEEEEDKDEDEDEDDENPVELPKLITKETVLAVLKPNGTEQVQVNINLVEDVEVVEFSITGPNPVHLLGHYIRQEDFDQDPYSDSEYDSNDESIPSDLEEDEDEDEDDESDLEGLSGLIDDDSEDEDPEDEEMDESRFEEIAQPKAASNKRAAEAAPEAGDESISSTLSKNQKKKLAKKLKGADGAAAPAPAPAPAPAAPAVKEAKPATTVEKKEAPKKRCSSVEQSTTQILAGGLQIIDAKKGDGPVAKNGKKVGMRYIGKLENGKIFDSNTKGTPLVFTLGRGEVIKGWEQGVLGMAVGGERKLVIPAALAYGKKGTQGIPGNATLIFDVKLVSVK
ncbi:BZ3500_MvSof-1268-A1-R1_Chr9g10381 [Microbotryum saponariae]|uniref:FK506-binding protein n=1 Tax=Microbotryum saponariae TaxID=289078 RepID=A0A2X0KT48_9BASI|nr:BZ3501_MvSof-1269-A2-R1_Chr9g10131 [Microbotryum saponariae]SCZ99993.1 BZ3500_MvSof-1268-A1-R1_Chr9g10381 [Microbotryum saponariae]